jgi:hypothetical protein
MFDDPRRASDRNRQKLAARSSIFFHPVTNNSDAASIISDDMTFENWQSHFDTAKPHADAEQRMYWL